MRALLQGTSLFFWGCQAACTPGQQPAILAGCRCGWRSRLRRRRCGLPSPTVILSRAAAPPAGAAPDSLQHLLRSGKASFCAHVRLHAASVEPNWKLVLFWAESTQPYKIFLGSCPSSLGPGPPVAGPLPAVRIISRAAAAYYPRAVPPRLNEGGNRYETHAVRRRHACRQHAMTPPQQHKSEEERIICTELLHCCPPLVPPARPPRPIQMSNGGPQRCGRQVRRLPGTSAASAHLDALFMSAANSSMLIRLRTRGRGPQLAPSPPEPAARPGAEAPPPARASRGAAPVAVLVHGGNHAGHLHLRLLVAHTSQHLHHLRLRAGQALSAGALSAAAPPPLQRSPPARAWSRYPSPFLSIALKAAAQPNWSSPASP